MYGFPNASKFPNDFALGVLAETAVGPLVFGGSVRRQRTSQMVFPTWTGILIIAERRPALCAALAAGTRVSNYPEFSGNGTLGLLDWAQNLKLS